MGSFIKNLYTGPHGGLIAMESRARCFPDGLAECISLRDDLCRTPYCNAAIRHTDHITPHQQGGPTSASNGQGLCERCNHAKQAPGWTTETRLTQMIGLHQVDVTTPTGHRHRAASPPDQPDPPPDRPPGIDIVWAPIPAA